MSGAYYQFYMKVCSVFNCKKKVKHTIKVGTIDFGYCKEHYFKKLNKNSYIKKLI